MRYYHFQILHKKEKEGKNKENANKKGKIRKQMRRYWKGRKSRLKHYDRRT
jgi:hypothetical protein